ncbi:polyhydroxyalkanoic acid system family protein [Candidatus Kaiserbacteria bacterium]|nr:polyhydroxyalkanoic acid system family protein [Candidatus Kaiserbacteria bacterium]
MHIQIPFKGSKSEAVARMKRALEEARPKMGDQATIHEERWEGDTLRFDVTAQGARISGTLAVGDSEMVVDAKLPLMMRLFEGKIERELGEQIKRMTQ